MNFKVLLDEAINRGEKIKEEVLAEIIKSKTIHEIVSNKNFIKAISRVIETKDEVKKVINKQVKSIFDMMDVPSQADLIRIAKQLTKLETLLSKVGAKNVMTKPAKKAKPVSKTKQVKKRTHKIIKKKTTGNKAIKQVKKPQKSKKK